MDRHAGDGAPRGEELHCQFLRLQPGQDPRLRRQLFLLDGGVRADPTGTSTPTQVARSLLSFPDHSVGVRGSNLPTGITHMDNTGEKATTQALYNTECLLRCILTGNTSVCAFIMKDKAFDNMYEAYVALILI